MYESLDGHVHEIGIAEQLCAVAVGAAHHLDEHVRPANVVECLEIETREHVEHIEQRDTPR